MLIWQRFFLDKYEDFNQHEQNTKFVQTLCFLGVKYILEI